MNRIAGFHAGDFHFRFRFHMRLQGERHLPQLAWRGLVGIAAFRELRDNPFFAHPGFQPQHLLSWSHGRQPP